MIKPMEIWSKNAEEKEISVEILHGCENSQPVNFRILRISATLLPDTCCRLLFDPPFVVLYKFALDVILVHLHIFVISLYLAPI